MFVSARPAGGRDGSVVLGIDPGLTRCGYAVLRSVGPQQVEALALGVVRTSASDDLPVRLGELHTEIASLLDEHTPDAVAVEQVFFQNNVRTAMSVGQASGVVLALAAAAGCAVVQYTPSQVKSAVTGWGGADKAQVTQMVQRRLGLDRAPKPADAADAAAIALCHCSVAPFRAAVASSIATAGSGR
ncbi:MAG: crossover junction endodeoxyribonuclease RuvC [Ilumatobacteraceae bacterium]